jgi:hypothetical protein
MPDRTWNKYRYKIFISSKVRIDEEINNRISVAGKL